MDFTDKSVMRTRALALMACLVSLVLVLTVAQATEKNKNCVDCRQSNKKKDPVSSSPIEKVVKILKGDRQHWIESTFVLDVRSTPGAIEVTSVGRGSRSDAQNRAYWAAVDPVYYKGKYGEDAPEDFDAYLKYLGKHGKGLPTSERLELLSRLGTRLSANYNYDENEITSGDELLDAIRKGSGKGGRCDDIHLFLNQTAAALGFKAAGAHSGLWKQGGNTGGHVVTHYQDPKTGEYYIQNYSQIVNTHEKSLTRALDLSLRVLGPFSSLSRVESKKGHQHNYTPRLARWARDKIEEQAGFQNERAVLSMKLGARERSFGLNLGTSNVKAFALHSTFEASDGNFSIGAIGLAAGFRGKMKLRSKILEEMGYAVEGYAGMSHISVPDLDPTGVRDGDGRDSRLNGIFGLKANGYARFNSVTGKIELIGRALDVGLPQGGASKDGLGGSASIPDVTLRPSVEYAPKGNPIRIRAERNLELQKRSINDQRMTVRTSFDKLSVVIDTRGGSSKAYVVTDIGVYLFEGIEKMSAVGLRNRIRAGVESDKLGDFYVVGDVSAILANPSKDPFYEAAPAVSFGAGWEKRLNKILSVGADLNLGTSAQPFFVFEEPGSVVPEYGKREGVQVQGDAWLRAQF